MKKLQCLVIMPFAASFDPVYQAVQAIAGKALVAEPIDCYWLKDVRAAGRITDDLLDGLKNAALCIADLTGNNPNVMWETGYAMALGKPTILIGQDVASLPFDLRAHRVLEYYPDALSTLDKLLAEAIRQTLARYEVRSSHDVAKPTQRSAPIIAITGSSNAETGKLTHRIKNLLQPYLNMGALWYCGSSGDTDEAVVTYLLGHKQRVVIVGYHRFDLSEGILPLVREGKVEFLDASVEPVPRGLAGPSERDSLFCAKADLVVLVWNGLSGGTGELVQYFKQNGKNLLLGFT